MTNIHHKGTKKRLCGPYNQCLSRKKHGFDSGGLNIQRKKDAFLQRRVHKTSGMRRGNLILKTKRLKMENVANGRSSLERFLAYGREAFSFYTAGVGMKRLDSHAVKHDELPTTKLESTQRERLSDGRENEGHKNVLALLSL